MMYNKHAYHTMALCDFIPDFHTTRLCEFLKINIAVGSIISGGSIQRAYHKTEDCGDIDVYGGSFQNMDLTDMGLTLLSEKVGVVQYYWPLIDKNIHFISASYLDKGFDISVCRPRIIDNCTIQMYECDRLSIIHKEGVVINQDKLSDKSAQRYLKYRIQGYRFDKKSDDLMMKVLTGEFRPNFSPNYQQPS